MTPQYLVSNRDVARFRVGTEDFFGVVALLAGETFAAAPVPPLTRATIDDFGQILAAFRTANLRGHRLRLFRHGREESGEFIGRSPMNFHKAGIAHRPVRRWLVLTTVNSSNPRTMQASHHPRSASG